MQNNQVFQEGDAIAIRGALTFETVSKVQQRIMSLLNNNLLSYSIDLKNISLVNSAALGLLVELKKKMVERKKTIEFQNPPERLLSLAEVCGVASWLGLKQN